MKYRKMRRFARMLFFAVPFLCLHVVPAHAAGGLVITEIMYDPAGSDDKREWVEVYNAGSADIDLSGHYILTDGLTSTHHSLVAQGSSVIPAGSYAVIVQDVSGFLGDYPGYAGLVFDSAWTGLTTTVGKTVAIIDSGGDVLDQTTYDPTIGGSNDGDSLQKNGAGAWVAAAPTPGAPFSANSVSSMASDPSSSSADDSAGTTATSTPATGDDSALGTSAAASPPPLKATAGASVQLVVPAHAVAGVPVTIADKAYESGSEPTSLGGTHFAMGDGGSHDGNAIESFSYTYAYPGTYVVSVAYSRDPYLPDADASVRATIEVAAPSVAISGVATDGSIELSNTGTREADISGWIVAPLEDIFSPVAFHIPSGTIVLAGKKISLPMKMTNLAMRDAESAVLALPSGAVVSSAPISVSAVSTASSTPSPDKPAASKKSASSKVVPKAVLEASAIGAVSSTAPAPVKKSASPWPFVLGLAGIIAAGVLAYFKFGASPKPRDSIRILEE